MRFAFGIQSLSQLLHFATHAAKVPIMWAIPGRVFHLGSVCELEPEFLRAHSVHTVLNCVGAFAGEAIYFRDI